jgi:hypothetical protein
MGKPLKRVRFKRWKGKQYGYRSPFGIPVMILGESHYDAKDKNSFFTRDVIREVIKGERNDRFYKNVAAAFLEGTVDQQKIADFWNSVVFYNYLQTSVELRTRPRAKVWRDAEGPFRDVLDSLKPRPSLIVVFGCQTWENTPNYGSDVPPIEHGRRKILCYEFGVARKKSLAPKLKHPSRAFDRKQTSRVILKALKRARRARIPRRRGLEVVFRIHTSCPSGFYKPDEPELDGVAEIIIAKQRNGPTGRIKLAFVKRSTRFESMAQDGMGPPE